MGGKGSGRLPDTKGVDIIMTDEEFKDGVAASAKLQFVIVQGKLMDIITGVAKDDVLDHMGRVIRKRRASLETIVKAIKGWKELTLDKTISDKKEAPINPNQAGLFDLMDHLKKMEDRILDEKKAKQKVRQEAIEKGDIKELPAVVNDR